MIKAEYYVHDFYIYINNKSMPSTKICKDCNKEFESHYGRIRCDKCKKPSVKCPHGTKKGRCKIDGCFGNEICEHKNHYQKCHICKPGMLIADKLNAYIRNFMKGNKIRSNTKKFILEYSSAPDLETLKIHLDSSLSKNNLKIDDCHLDHIKCKALYNLKDDVQLKQCCHYKNLQFISSTDNLKKGKSIVDDVDDLFQKLKL